MRTQEDVDIPPYPSNPEIPQSKFMCSKHTGIYTQLKTLFHGLLQVTEVPNICIHTQYEDLEAQPSGGTFWLCECYRFLQNMGGHTSILQLWKVFECGQYGAQRMVSNNGVTRNLCVLVLEKQSFI